MHFFVYSINQVFICVWWKVILILCVLYLAVIFENSLKLTDSGLMHRINSIAIFRLIQSDWVSKWEYYYTSVLMPNVRGEHNWLLFASKCFGLLPMKDEWEKRREIDRKGIKRRWRWWNKIEKGRIEREKGNPRIIARRMARDDNKKRWQERMTRERREEKVPIFY